jgi:hypothetical protein
MPMRTITIILLVILTSLSQAQESYLYKRTNIKLGHSKTPQYLNSTKDFALGNFRFEANRVLCRFVETGVYIGYSRFVNFLHTEDYLAPNNQVSPGTFINSNAYSYGITANFHLLPLIANKDEPRFDMYVSAKFGGLSLVAPEGSVYKGHGVDYGLYGGLSYYITPNWGIFTEYGFNNRPKEHSIESCLRYGITVKF